MKIAKNNLDVQIAILEAKLGITPNIQWCADAVKNPKLSKKLEDMSELAMKEELQKLRVEKAKQKLFWIQKELNRSVKKAKAFNVQKIVKKIKSLPDDQRATFDDDLKAAKALDHMRMATLIYQDSILNSIREYIATTLTSLGLQSTLASGTEEYRNILQQKALSNDIEVLQNDLESFLRKLLHEPIKVEKSVKEAKEPSKISDTISEEEARQEFFVSSLNQNSDNEQEDVPKRKKNRMGQKARRALAESRYGKSANHFRAEAPRQRPQTKLSHDLAKKGARLAPEELHPSWQAKQLAKQKEQNAHFQGTKKVFSDD